MKLSPRQSGLTLIEATVAISIAAGIALAGTTLGQLGMKDASAAYRRTVLASRSATASEMLVRELQAASMEGEDQNGNRRLDPGEDVNRNGRLDSDWNLANGDSTGDLSFNVPRPNVLWSGQIRYRFVDDLLLRSEGGIDQVVCRNVTAFSVTRDGSKIDISLRLDRRDSFGNLWSSTAERRAHVRN